jgi:hypothetical protein
VSTICCSWPLPLPPHSGLWRDGEGEVAHLVRMSSSDVTGRLCVVRVVACGLLAGVRCAEDIIEWSVLKCHVKELCIQITCIECCPGKKSWIHARNWKLNSNLIDFCVNVCVVIVSPSLAPPAESVRRPRTGWIARWCSVGCCYRSFYEEEKKRDYQEYCALYAWLILCHEAVRNIYPIREHQNPIHSLYVLTPIAAS